MKTFFISVGGFLYMAILSALCAKLFMWLSPFVIVGSWVKAILILVFGITILEWLFNMIIPFVTALPFSSVNPKRAKTVHLIAAIPAIPIGILFLYDLWHNYASTVQFGVKEWIMAISWTLWTAKQFWSLFYSQISLLGMQLNRIQQNGIDE
jgi:uncharacterized membrane protein